MALLGTLALLSSWFESVMTVRTSVTFIGSKFLFQIFTSSLQDWMAFTKLKTDNFTLTDSLVFTNNNSPSNKQDNNAICQVVPFDSCFKACLNQFVGFNFKYKHFSHLHLVSSLILSDAVFHCLSKSRDWHWPSNRQNVSPTKLRGLVKLYSPYFIVFVWLIARALESQLLIMSM